MRKGGEGLLLSLRMEILDKQVALGGYYLCEPFSLQDAQNRVAAFALCHLFPDLPVHLLVTEPYASLVIQWKEGEIFFSQDIKLKVNSWRCLNSCIFA